MQTDIGSFVEEEEDGVAADEAIKETKKNLRSKERKTCVSNTRVGKKNPRGRVITNLIGDGGSSRGRVIPNLIGDGGPSRGRALDRSKTNNLSL